MPPLRSGHRAISLIMAITAMTTAGVLVPPSLAQASTRQTETVTQQGPRADARSAAQAQASLALLLHAAQPAMTGEDASAPSLTAVAGTSSLLVVSLSALAIVDRTSARTAPSFSVTLPAGLTFVSVADSLDPGVSGSWACTGTTTVMCALGSSGGAAGRMAQGDIAGAVLTLRADSTVAEGEDLGSVEVSASVRATGANGELASLTATSSVAVIGGSVQPPDVRVRQVPADAERTRNVLTVRVLPLSDLPASDPVVHVTQMVPAGATDVTFDRASGWTCSLQHSGSCVSTRTLATGAPTDLTVRFTAPGSAASLEWTVQSSFNGGPATKNAQIPTGLVIEQPRAVPDPANFDVQIRSAKGQGIRAGGRALVQVVVTNLSRDAYTPTLALNAPDGIGLAESSDAWSCTEATDLECRGPRLRAGQTSSFMLRVRADEAMDPGVAVLTAGATPGNNAQARHPLQVIDPGDPFPAIELRTFAGGSTRAWGDGHSLNAAVGEDTRYRVVVRNVGGVPLQRGRSFTVSQAADKGVRFVSVDAGRGTVCSLTAAGIAWTCTMRALSAIRVGGVAGAVTVTVRASERSAALPLSPVSARVTGSGLEPVTEPVDIQGIQPRIPLRVATTLVGGVTLGGTAPATLRVRNESTRSVSGLTVVGTMPSGVTATARASADWSCVTSGVQTSCTYAGRLAKGARTSAIRLTLNADRTASVGSRLARWRVQGVDPSYAEGRGATRVEIHGVERISASALPSVIGVRPAWARASSVILRVATRTPSSRVWHHSWAQACLTEAERQAVPECADASTNRVRIFGPMRTRALARIPITRDDATYVFKVIASDGSAGVVDYVTVSAAGRSSSVQPRLPFLDARTGRAPIADRTPANRGVSAVGVSTTSVAVGQSARARAAAWLTADDAASRMIETRAWSPSREFDITAMSRSGLFIPMDTPLKVSITGGALADVATGEQLSLPAIASGGSQPYSYEWTRIVGSRPDLTSATSSTATLVGVSGRRLATYEVTVTDAAGQTAVDTVTVVFNPVITTLFCSLWNRADEGSDRITRQLGGGVRANFRNYATLGRSCTPDAALTFDSTTITYGGFTIADASGVVTASGISVSSASLKVPSVWGLSDLEIGDAGLVIALAETSSEAATLNGRFTTGTFAFLPVPSGWRATTRMIFTAGDGETALALAASADGPGRSAATLSGTVTSEGTFSVTGTATSLVTVGDGDVDVSGTIRLTDPNGAVSGSLRGALATPATIVDGITIPSLSVVWDTNATTVVSGSGTVAFTAGADTIDIDISLDYSSMSDWVLRLRGGGTKVWEPVSGLKVRPSDFSGSIRRTSGDYDWQVRAALSSPWTMTPAVTISHLSLTIATSCPDDVQQDVTCPEAETYLGLAGRATVNARPVDSFTVTVSGVTALGGGSGMAMSAAVTGNIDLAQGLTLTDATFTATYGLGAREPGPTLSDSTDGGFSVQIRADAEIPSVGSFTHLHVHVTDGGWAFGAFSSGLQLGDADAYGSFSTSVVTYSSMPTTVTVPASYGIDPVVFAECRGAASDGQTCTGSVYVAGNYTAPGWFTKASGGSALVSSAVVQVDPSDGSFNAKVSVDLGSGGVSLPTGGSSTLTAGSLFFQLQQTSGRVIVTAGGEVDLGMPGSDYGSGPPTLAMMMSYDVTSSTVQAALTYNDREGWQDAFGMPGLDLFELTLALQINLVTLTPALGLSASAELPDNLENAFFDLSPNTPVQAFVNLSVTTPCLGVTIGIDQEGAPVAFSLAGGVLTATYVELYVAPVGCVIGTTVYPAGYRFAFSGTVLDVPVAANIEVGLTPVSIDATLAVGDFQVGPLVMDDTQIGITYVAGVKNEISFSGGFELFGTDVTASGSLGYEVATKTTSATLDVDVTNFGVSGFRLRNASISLDVTSSPRSTDVEFAGSAYIDILGDTLDIKQFDFTIENNVVTEVSADVAADLSLGGSIGFDGNFNVAYTATPMDFTIAADVSVSLGDYTLSRAKLSVTPSCAALDASLDVPGLLTANVGGYVVYGADCTVTDALTGATSSISGSSGAFCAFVDNVNLSMGGFRASGAVSLSNNGDLDCSGASTAANEIVGSIDVEIMLGAQGVNNTAHVFGEFSSDGTYSFTGTSALNIGGINLNMAVTAAKDEDSQSVEGSASLGVLGNRLSFSGSFTNDNGAVSVILQASANPLSLGGFDVGSGQVRLAQTPNEFGMSFEMTLHAGGASMKSVLSFKQVNGDFLFYTYVSLTLGIPGVASVSAAGSFTNCTNENCTAFGGYELTASMSFSFGGWSYSSPKFRIGTDGTFSFTVSEGRCCQSTPATDVAGVNWWTANNSWQIDLTVNQSGASGRASGQATIYSQAAALKYPCGPWYWVFKKWCTYPVTNWGTVGARASVNPWSFCVRISSSPWICL